MWSPTRRGFLGGLVGGAAAGIASGEPLALAGEAAAAEPKTPLKCTVNGALRETEVGADSSALDFVRRTCGLKGAKLGCGHGVCGACTIQVNGTPMVSCLLPAAHLHGAEVTTVEHFDPLHPIQKAFLAEDALQCGYCTPGFVVEAIAFHDAWRRDHGTSTPPRSAVDAALAGHVCRCGAYASIIAAVTAACEGKFDAGDFTMPRADGLEKVTGKAEYTVDVQLEGQLEGRILRSPHGAARVLELDLEAARAIDGVFAVVRLIIPAGTVRYAGQAIAAVAAKDRSVADLAMAAISVKYEVFKPVIGIAAARADGARPVYERKREKKQAPPAGEGPMLPTHWKGNERGPASSHILAKPHAADRAVKRAETEGWLADRVFKTQCQVHTPLEPRACVASWRDGRLEVRVSTQAVADMAVDICEHWELSRDQVTVLAPYVGGAFGSKVGLDMETRAAIELTRACGLPVRVVVDRHEELMIGGNRPAQELEMQVAISAERELDGIVSIARSDSGVSVGASTGFNVRLVYKGKERRLEDTDCITNGPPAKPFRGPGGPPAMFALEGCMDDLAVRMGEDSIQAHLRWDQHVVRRKMYAVLAEVPWWKDRPKEPGTGRYRRGVGLAIAAWPYFLSPGTHVRVDAGLDGITASAAIQDLGTGSRSVIANAVADVLGVPPEKIKVRVGDSRDAHGPMSAGSRTTASVYPAARRAAAELVKELVESAEGLGLVGVVRAPGGIKHRDGFMSWEDLAKLAPTTVIKRRPRDPGGYFLPLAVGGIAVGKNLAGAVTAMEVEVDTRLGQVRATRAWLGIGSGKLAAPALARSQAEGGVLQGVSYALYEERFLDPGTGRLLTHDLEHYRIAGIGDCPEIEVHFDTSGFTEANGGPVGLAELCTVGVAGAVGNAVFRATGWRPQELPIRPERVLAGVRA